MEFIIINHNELSALNGLPYLQQLTYIRGIKPYVDYKTRLVGVRRGVSYQSLLEALYIEPHQGIQSGSPSKDQVRRSLKALEKAGLIQIQSSDSTLIFKCLLLDRDNSIQNKLATKSPSQTAINQQGNTIEKSYGYVKKTENPTTQKSPKPAIPQDNNKYLLFFLLNAFDEFWEGYPLKQNKDAALEAFKNLNPSQALIAEIKAGLQKQIEFYQQQQTAGIWMPAWKYPANWLTQKCWKNRPAMHESQQENHRETHQQHSGIQSTAIAIQSERSDDATGFTDAEFNQLWKTH